MTTTMHTATPEHLEEQRLFDRLAAGDLEAFDAFSRRLERPVFSYLLRLVRNRAEAEDLTQEAMLRLYKMARKQSIRNTGGSPRSLVFRIAHNLAMDYYRKVRRQGELEAATPPPASRKAEAVLLRQQIDRALADLPEQHRNAIMLREFGDLSYQEIASTLGASLDQVKVWIHRARKKLATLLDKDGQYVGSTPAPSTVGTSMEDTPNAC